MDKLNIINDGVFFSKVAAAKKGKTNSALKELTRSQYAVKWEERKACWQKRTLCKSILLKKVL